MYNIRSFSERKPFGFAWTGRGQDRVEGGCSVIGKKSPRWGNRAEHRAKGSVRQTRKKCSDVTFQESDFSSWHFSQAFKTWHFWQIWNFFRDALNVGGAIRIDAERVKIVPLHRDLTIHGRCLLNHLNRWTVLCSSRTCSLDSVIGCTLRLYEVDTRCACLAGDRSECARRAGRPDLLTKLIERKPRHATRW
jgi:hypothetical protein